MFVQNLHSGDLRSPVCKSFAKLTYIINIHCIQLHQKKIWPFDQTGNRLIQFSSPHWINRHCSTFFLIRMGQPLIVNMILFAHISNFFKWKYLHYDVKNNILGYVRWLCCILYAKGKILLDKCVYISIWKRKIFSSILCQVSFVYTLVKSYIILLHTHTPHNTIEHTHAKRLAHLNAKCHKVSILIQLLVISVT